MGEALGGGSAQTMVRTQHSSKSFITKTWMRQVVLSATLWRSGHSLLALADLILLSDTTNFVSHT